MYFIGIDWSDEKHTIVILDKYCKDIAKFEIPHSFEGMTEFTRRLETLNIPIDKAHCFIETSRGLLVGFLLEHGFTVYPLNPKIVDKHRKPSGAKTDFIDARLLADLGRKDHVTLKPLKPSNDLIQELRLLTRDQEGLIRAQTRLTNQLIACLKEYYPAALQFFSRVGQLCTLRFLEAYPTINSLKKETEEKISDLLVTLRHKNPDAKAKEIYKIVHQSQIPVVKTVEKAKSRLMTVLVKQLMLLVEEISAYDKLIQSIFKDHKNCDIFQSLPWCW